MLLRAIDRFFSHEASGGILLMLSAVAALVVANSGLAGIYDSFLDARLGLMVNGEGLEKPAILWINDGLMAVFFFLIGLELKREILEGKLKNPRDVILPGAAAIGGMALPALVYVAINWGNPATLAGWAIPAATDIAFALGILALVGSRAPSSLKVFLLTLAILDDLGAIVIIALFYTADLKVDYLFSALIPLALLLFLNYKRVHRVAPMILLGAVMWYFVLKSGVHATLAGVITAFCIPMTDKWGKSPLHSLEHGLAPYVLYFIVPVFAFANAGVVLQGMSLSALLAPLPLGIALGLILGKQLGVFGVTFVLVRSGLTRMPHGANWLHIYGLSCLAGVGFTMSLFIGSLSFDDALLMNQVRLGVLSGSLVSGLIGYGALMLASDAREEAEPEAAEVA
ncbi:MAG: Na+/H+ antiporter NhaA [Marinovum algicola]|uniref:Na(+)/H(+) antiporter NhaA n=1 Tax=Marinovum algicola TaxID=42444 RepID=A0A975W676_9RHOB|nr:MULTISPECIES: Na+/H+ antiporter NhaA [Marinovum]MDD9741183.1 Na+/H+ antiporter NhaA [Marinovum sp. SP66]SEI55353.1 sodium/proton antiporter, NhaA family [Marinovum algicola]SLN28822.1 Na(+)/H(+) antiporter NhaA [Marinovum algicola]